MSHTERINDALARPGWAQQIPCGIKDDIRRLLAEVDTQREIINKLPLTEDGVRVVPGIDPVFMCIKTATRKGIVCITEGDDEQTATFFAAFGWWSGVGDLATKHFASYEMSEVSATHEAAEAAKEEKTK